MTQHAVLTVTQGEKCDIPKRSSSKTWIYTSYDRYLTIYRVDQPIQLRLQVERRRQRHEGGRHG